MDAHAHLVKALIQQQLLGRIHHTQLLPGDRVPIRKTACQAGEGLLIPGRQPEMAGKSADFLLCQSRMAQGALYSQLSHSLHSGTVIAFVVQVGSLGNCRHAFRLGHLADLAEQLALAQVAAVRRVLGKTLDLQLVKRDDKLPDALGFAKRLRLLKLPFREHARRNRHCKRRFPQGLMRCMQQQGGIDAAGKGNRNAAQCGKAFLQHLVFCQQHIIHSRPLLIRTEERTRLPTAQSPPDPSQPRPR